MKWLLVFHRVSAGAEAVRGVGRNAEYAYVNAACGADEIIGAKEAAAMELEQKNGGLWICTAVLPVEAGG